MKSKRIEAIVVIVVALIVKKDNIRTVRSPTWKVILKGWQVHIDNDLVFPSKQRWDKIAVDAKVQGRNLRLPLAFMKVS